MLTEKEASQILSLPQRAITVATAAPHPCPPHGLLKGIGGLAFPWGVSGLTVVSHFPSVSRTLVSVWEAKGLRLRDGVSKA